MDMWQMFVATVYTPDDPALRKTLAVELRFSVS